MLIGQKLHQSALSDFSVHVLIHEKNEQTAEHTHATGQLFFLNSGMISCITEDKYWSIAAHCIGWVPPMTVHSAKIWGNVSAWSLHLPRDMCQYLPNQPCVLQTNALIDALFSRIVTFNYANGIFDEQRRILAVLMDEIKNSPYVDTLLLPYPKNPRLVKITQAIWQDPALSHSQIQWASLVGMSVRSFSRHFIAETGMTFSHWKQCAKLMISLEKLAQNLPITDVAYSSGFSDTSAYIASFKSIFGTSPKRYFAQ